MSPVVVVSSITPPSFSPYALLNALPVQVSPTEVLIALRKMKACTRENQLRKLGGYVFSHRIQGVSTPV